MQVDAAAAPALPRNGEYPLIDLGLDAISRQFDALASGAGTPAGESMPARPLPRSEIEFITVRKSLATAYADIQYRARRSLEAFDRGIDAPDTEGMERARRDALERGVHYRVVYDPAAFKRESRAPLGPGSAPSRIQRARLLDRSHSLGHSRRGRIAWFSAVQTTRAGSWGFESTTRGSPHSSTTRSKPSGDPRRPRPTTAVATSPRLSSEEQEILRLLATGLTDDSIARVARRQLADDPAQGASHPEKFRGNKPLSAGSHERGVGWLTKQHDRLQFERPHMPAKTIVITGASDGIGASSARQLKDLGHQVVVVGRNPEKTKAIATELGAEFHLADFARPGPGAQLSPPNSWPLIRVSTSSQTMPAGYSRPSGKRPSMVLNSLSRSTTWHRSC